MVFDHTPTPPKRKQTLTTPFFLWMWQWALHVVSRMASQLHSKNILQNLCQIYTFILAKGFQFLVKHSFLLHLMV